jgi:LCP family protein required for cell wall assembly
VLGGLGYAFFLVIALAVGSGYGWVSQSKTMTALVKGIIFDPKPPEEIFANRDGITLLLLGCDEDRYYRGVTANGSNIRRKQARSDMMLVARLDFRTNRITGVSIPRDTECQLPGYRRMKINHYHSIAPKGQEAQLTKQAVEYILPGVVIDRVLTIDYDAFKDMVDTVGGVKVNIEKRMVYHDNAGDVHIDFHPGPTKLDGYNAMMFVRYRHGDNDFKRQERQKQFLTAFKDSVMRDKIKLPQVFEKATAALGNSLTAEEIASIAFFARNVPSTNIEMGQIPVREGRGTYLKVDEDKLSETLERYGLVGSYGMVSSTR